MFWDLGCTDLVHGWKTLPTREHEIPSHSEHRRQIKVPVLFRRLAKQDFPLGCPKPRPARMFPVVLLALD